MGVVSNVMEVVVLMGVDELFDPFTPEGHIRLEFF